MGRRTKKKELEDRPMFVKCGSCNERVHYKAPMEGVLYQIGDNFAAICSDCATTMLQVLDIMKQRWG